jgi:hypothetical protein
MSTTSLLLLLLFGIAGGLLLLSAAVGFWLWRARKEAARQKSLVGAL